MVWSEFGVNKMKAYIYPTLYQWFRLVVVVLWCGGYYSSQFWHIAATVAMVLDVKINIQLTENEAKD